MTIPEIKERLTLSEVIRHYGLKADKQNRVNCPFHEDRTPSMQLYYKTHTAYCFSGNCPTHGHSMDVIELVQRMEKTDKHQAIEKCKTLIGGEAAAHPAAQLSRAAVLSRLFTYFKNAVHNSPPARQYLESRGLDFKKLEVGYNAGQFHHGTRKEEHLVQSCLKYGLLIDKNLVSRTGEKAYQPFGKYCLVFALRNQQNHLSGMYFRSTINDKEAKHFYLKDRSGLYPGYPSTHTRKLILTEAVVDAASLLMSDAVTAEYEVLAAYGTNGLTEEHIKAILSLEKLEEIIFFFDGDGAGRQAISKYGGSLGQMLPQVRISQVNTPEGEDINSLLQGHKPEILEHYLKERVRFEPVEQVIFYSQNLSFSNGVHENASLSSTENPSVETKNVPLPEYPEPASPPSPEPGKHLNAGNPNNIHFNGAAAGYTIKGGLKPQLDSLKITLQVIHKESRQDYRTKIDLYEYKQLQGAADTASELLGLPKDGVEKDLRLLAHLLENYREELLRSQPQKQLHKAIIKVPEATTAQCIAFMKRPNLLQEFNKLIGQAGVTGEETARIFLFTVATSYKMGDTLHALIQGSSGSGKTRLLKIISSLMPPEDVKRFTRVTENSFYNYGEYDLSNLFLCFEDIDGLEEKALLALRELQSNDILISSTSQKNENGSIQSAERIVRGPIASIACTTKGDYYEDNVSRCFVIAVDESREQTRRIIQYQNNRAAGEIDEKKEKDITSFIQNCVRLLKPCEVINPYANKIELPQEAHKIRRLNEMYQAIVRQITILNQYQRKLSPGGKLIADKQDMADACEILFESIVLKVDELDGSLRQFYEKLKSFVQQQGKEYEFSRFEVMAATGVKKTQQHVYINKLVQLEYIRQYGFANKGFKYKISYWDNIQQVRAKIKDHLNNQLQAL